MKSILLVDADPMGLDDLRLRLARHSDDWKVTTAHSGLEALPLARAQSFDLLITDIRFSEQHGLGTISALRGMRPRLKVMAIARGQQMSDRAWMQVVRGLGANEVLEKPFADETLFRVLHGLLNSNQHP